MHVVDSAADAEVPVDSVVQHPWTLTEAVDIVKYLDHGLTEPVMKVTIIRFTKTGSTSIGLSAMHFMGALNIIMVICTVSDLYCL